MPALLPRDAEAAWLDPKTPPERLREMLNPYPSELLDVRLVTSRVSDATLDEASLLDAAPQAQGDLFGAG